MKKDETQLIDETQNETQEEEEFSTGKKKIKNVTCQRCEKIFPEYLTDQHHYPISKRDGGTELEIWCKKCHDEHHGITPIMNLFKQECKIFYDYQSFRKSIENKIGAATRLEQDKMIIKSLEKQLKVFEDLEATKEKEIAKLIKKQPLWLTYLKDVKGIGPLYAANLLGYIGNIKRFPTVSSLWKYAGLAVVNGQSDRRIKGQHISYNPYLKTLCLGKIADNFVRSGKKNAGTYRILYDKYKAEEQEKHPEPVKSTKTTGPKQFYTKGHIEKLTRRKVVKEFVKELYLQWQTVETPEEIETVIKMKPRLMLSTKKTVKHQKKNETRVVLKSRDIMSQKRKVKK